MEKIYINNRRKTRTRRIACKGNSKEDIYNRETKAGCMCSKDWKEKPVFQNCFHTNLSLEKKIADHIIKLAELATTDTKDFP